jgi:hypothetical protein
VKKLIFHSLIFSVLTFSSLYGFQYFLDKENRKIDSDTYKEWNDCYSSKINADVLVMGASRACYHISPFIVDSVLGINSYNLGMVGWTFLMQNCRLKVYLQHNVLPKTIVHSVDVLILEKRPDLYKGEQFAPYLYDTLIQRYTQGYKGSFNNFHYYFPMYKYNYALKGIIAPMLNYTGIKKSRAVKYKGYEGLDETWDDSFDNFVANNPNGIKRVIDNETLKEFVEYIKFCKANNINLIFVYAPEYFEAQKITKNRAEIVQLYKNFASNYNLTFIDYSNDSICLDKNYFVNSQHLNKKGAELFSTQLAIDLKGILKNYKQLSEKIGDTDSLNMREF